MYGKRHGNAIFKDSTLVVVCHHVVECLACQVDTFNYPYTMPVQSRGIVRKQIQLSESYMTLESFSGKGAIGPPSACDVSGCL